jgi:predicted ATPase/GAF domain-containing protein/tRNA A-37 threonylcarbamoyl transferase component Bud32
MIDLPGYSLTDTAFEGSETIVYRGLREADGARVAVKITRNEYPTARELARLRRERDILDAVRTVPGVGRAYALEKQGRGIALVLEDLGPCSLAGVLAARRLSVGEALGVAHAVAGTLSALHALGVIHKDIKPLNVMVDEATLTPRLVDFGIAARLSQETAPAASPAGLEGTLAYIAPEQTGRMNRVVDRRADLYSLGVVLYEMLTGALPFTATDPTELIHAHIARPPTPPHVHAPEVPEVVSAIVMRLLAKTPEERYQTARGLEADLEVCLNEWRATGAVSRFPLGRRDHPGTLAIPQRLYGREAQIDALLGAFEEARHGRAAWVMVTGQGGVGKSALVAEIHKPIAKQGGYFTRGKFDVMSRDAPLAPIVQAFRELLRQILTEPSAVLAQVQARLLAAVSANGRLLIELVPELEFIIGPQPEVLAVGPMEAQNRFGLLAQRVVRALASPERPLCIFLDDLQWADPASLRLLTLLLADPETKHLLIVGAYRDDEVDPAHPLHGALAEARRAEATMIELTLEPLDAPTTGRLVAEALVAAEKETAPLAALVFEKTRGNPFFIGQFLRALESSGLVRFDAATAVFTWDLGAIARAEVTDNVARLLAGNLKRLSPEAQRALVRAACVGHAFDLATLATVAERPEPVVAAALWEALREGLVVPVGGDYRYFEASAGPTPPSGAPAVRSAPAVSGAPAVTELQASYRFLHDRVREAAYALLDDASKETAHLSVGRLLLAQRGLPLPDQDVLEIVRHLNLGARLISDESEQLAAAALDLRAGRRARAATAYTSAAGYFEAGLRLLGASGWDRAYELAFALHLEGAACAYLGGAPAAAETLFEALLPRARSPLEKARVQSLRVVLYTTLGRFADALRVGLDGLASVSVTLPEGAEAQQAAFGEGLARVAKNLGDRSVASLADAPRMSDPAREVALELLCDLAIPIYFVSPSLYGASVLEQVNMSLEHGHSSVSAFAYSTYGFMLSAMLGNPAAGNAFGRLALAVEEKIPNPALTCKLLLVFCGHAYLSQPVREILPYYARARAAALEAGDFVYLASSSYALLPVKLGAGFQLDDLCAEAELDRAVARRTKDVTAIGVTTLSQQVIANLAGRTRGRLTLSDEVFDEDTFRAAIDDKAQGAVAFYLHAYRLQVFYLHGAFAEAVAAAEQAEAYSMSLFGMYATTRVHLYAALALAALASLPEAPPEEAEKRRTAVSRHRERLAVLAGHCPANFAHQLAIVDAEIARLAGEDDRALDLYDEAVALAKKAEAPHDEALANELAARCYLALGKPKLARPYMTDAHAGYLHWGAYAKADDLARDHGALLPAAHVDRRGDRRRTSTSSTSTTRGTTLLTGTTLGSLREAAQVVRAAQVIAGEIMLPKIIERVSRIVLENAAAQRGALLIARGGRLFVEATFAAHPEAFELGLGAPLESRADLVRSAILLAARMGEVVAIDDAAADARFSADPRAMAGEVRSVLCLPFLHQGRLSGLLYLEHQEAIAAFNEARVELLGLFASQAAIAIENAVLVEEVRSANERLEREVSERTLELSAANRELGATNARLSVELREREQVEQERTLLQEQMIEAQRARLAELSTPLIPITDRVMVMPLIGAVDEDRAAQVIEVALRGAQQHRARVVILDITGMHHVDDRAVGALLSAASALRLLGAQAVLTGVRPEVAQAMVAFGDRIDSLVTLGTLESGIAYALRHVEGSTKELRRVSPSSKRPR